MLLKEIRLRVFGRVYLGHRQLKGWRGPLPFYLFRCPVHGLVENYPQGFDGALRCPRCTSDTAVGTE